MREALSNGYSVIRVLQKDVLADRTDWRRDIADEIAKCTREQTPQCVFISGGNEYTVFMDQFTQNDREQKIEDDLVDITEEELIDLLDDTI